MISEQGPPRADGQGCLDTNPPPRAGAGGANLVVQAASPQASRCELVVEAASEASRCALLEHTPGRVLFEGVALGPGVYVDAAGRRVRVRPDQLPLVAERLRGAFLRDLHREDLGASVGVVASARVEGAEVTFTGDVRRAPYVEILREFGQHVRFSVGFRYHAASLKAEGDGTYDLPDEFLIDHVALVPQGQYPNARLVRLLNEARGSLTSLSKSVVPMADNDPTTEAASEASRREGTAGDDPGEAARPSEEARAGPAAVHADLAAGEAVSALARARAALAASEEARRRAEAASEASRRELGQAKSRLAAEVMKLELAAGKDFDLDQRRRDLAALELVALDRLRGELRLAAAGEGGREKSGTAPPATRADRRAEPEVAPPGGLDLAQLSLSDTLRLAFQQGAF